MITKNIKYLVAGESVPAVLLEDADGNQYGFEYLRGKWTPTESTKLFMGAAMISRGQFVGLFPLVGLPAEANSQS